MTEAYAEKVTRAVLRVLKYDPDAHDLTPVKGRWPGYRITDAQGKAIRFVRAAEVDKLCADPETQLAMQAFIETDGIA